jgi:hypothetical protein
MELKRNKTSDDRSKYTDIRVTEAEIQKDPENLEGPEFTTH